MVTNKKKRISFRRRLEIQSVARKQVDELYDDIIKPYQKSYLKYKFSNLGSDKVNIREKTDKKLTKDVNKWIYKNYYDVIQKTDFYSDFIDNRNLNFSTSDTGYVPNSIEFFDRMTSKDTHIYGAVWSIIDSVTSRKWEIVPSVNSSNSFDSSIYIETVFKDILPDFSEVIETLAKSIITGFSIQEVIWGNVDGDIMPIDIQYREPINFDFDKYGNLYYIKSNAFDRVLVPRGKFLIHSYKGNELNPFGESIIGERVFWMYFFKKTIWRFRLRFLERFGNPLMLHEYQTEEERILMNTALKYMASKGAIQVPEGSKITPVEVQRDTADFKNAIDDLNKEIEIAIVGQTATMSRESGGSYASDYIRQDQFYNKIGALLQSIESTINKDLIKPIIKMKFPKERFFPKILFNKNDDVLKIKETERDLSLIRQQSPVPIIYLFRKLGIPIPKDMDKSMTYAPYYNEKGAISGGLPPEIRHQIRTPLDDPRLKDVDASYLPTNKVNSEIKRTEKQQDKRDEESRVKDPNKGKPIDNKGSVGNQRNNKKSIK